MGNSHTGVTNYYKLIEKPNAEYVWYKGPHLEEGLYFWLHWVNERREKIGRIEKDTGHLIMWEADSQHLRKATPTEIALYASK